MHVALRMFIMQVLASQLHFLANTNTGLAIPPLFWLVNCIKIGGHVALLSGPTVYSLYCGFNRLLHLYSEEKCLYFYQTLLVSSSAVLLGDKSKLNSPGFILVNL